MEAVENLAFHFVYPEACALLYLRTWFRLQYLHVLKPELDHGYDLEHNRQPHCFIVLRRRLRRFLDLVEEPCSV